jgi:cytochrome P450
LFRGTVVVPNLYSMMHNPADFPSPRTFQPERHLSDGRFVPHAHVLPFGTGKRKCAGENVAKMQVICLWQSQIELKFFNITIYRANLINMNNKA